MTEFKAAAVARLEQPDETLRSIAQALVWPQHKGRPGGWNSRSAGW